MLALVLMIGMQEAAAPPVPEKFSILAPACRRDDTDTDIVVCAAPEQTARLPLPADRGPPDRPMPGNPHLATTDALGAGGMPCAASQGGCQVGVNVLAAPIAAIRLLTRLINPANDCCAPGEATDPGALLRDGYAGIKRAVAKKPDKSRRVPIDLDEPPVPAPPP